MTTKKVYAAINAVTADLAKDGIGKDRRNQAQGYNFRGIDDVFNALAPVLAKNHLCVIPRMYNRQVSERVNNKGTAIFYVTVEAEFDFVSAEDGSLHTVRTFGEAMDSADKATNKAMSAAYKYAALMTFSIPTEGEDKDTESSHHEVSSTEDVELLKKYKDAAIEGMAQLQAFHSMAKGQSKARVWAAHGEDLKTKAKLADLQKKEEVAA